MSQIAEKAATMDKESDKGIKLLIEAASLTKVYESDGVSFEALKGMSIAIGQGEFSAITGESGSGKSTLLSILGAISPPTTGSLHIDGIDVYGLGIERLADFRREYIGFVFQQFHLIPYLTAAENVMLPLSITSIKDSTQKEMAHAALDRVGLGSKARRLPSQMSGGEQQRVAVARALVNEPPMILADEPTGNLDTKTGGEIFGLLKRLNEAGQTVIVVTHNQELALKTDRIIRMKDGLVEFDSRNQEG